LVLAALIGVGLSSAAPVSSAAVLEARVRQLEDQDAIRKILVDYGVHLDAQDYARYAALFAKDGVWTGGYGTAKGPAAIQAMLEKAMGKPAPGFINKTKSHLMTTMVVTVTGDMATARSRFLVLTADETGKPVPSRAGRYVDQFVREPGGWKIKSRTTYGVIPYADDSAAGARR
jgi:ketosteroid isomerase-like protein